MKLILKDKQEIEISNTNINYNTNLSEDERRSITFVLDEPTLTTENLIKMLTRENLEHIEINSAAKTEYSNAIVHAFQGFRAPFSGKIVHIFPEQSAAFN